MVVGGLTCGSVWSPRPNNSNKSASTGADRVNDVQVCTISMRLSSKLGLAGAVSVWTAGVVCYHTQALDNSWLSSWRAVRFGRAAYAVSLTVFNII